MLQPIKFENTDNSKVYFWGCLHVFHDPKWDVPIWKGRGYNSVEEHAQGIKDKINNTCGPEDHLFIIGDGFLNSTPEQCANFLFSLNPTIHYLFGNHESSTIKLYRQYRDYQYEYIVGFNKNDEVYPLKYRNLVFWGNYLEIQIGKKLCVLSHYPIRVFNNSARGSYMIHSHCHGGLESSYPKSKEGLILETSVDVFPDGPVSFDEVHEIMRNKDIKSFDKHH